MPQYLMPENYSALGADFDEDIFSFNALNASISPRVDFSDSWLILSIVLPLPGAAFFLGAATVLSSSVDQVAFKLSVMRLSSFENSSTLKSYDSPTSAFELSSFAKFF